MRVGSWTTDENDLLLTNDLVQVRQISVSSMDNNVYLVTCSATGAQLLVDAADEAKQIGSLVAGAGNGRLETVVTTHQHWDHHRALVAVAESTGAHTAAGRPDAEHLPLTPRTALDHDDCVQVGAVELRVIALRGHTPGSIALALPSGGPEGETVLFTGDSLFPGGPGKTESSQDFESLINDLTERVFADYDDWTLVLPGHGDGTTLGAERGQLGAWRQRGW